MSLSLQTELGYSWEVYLAPNGPSLSRFQVPDLMPSADGMARTSGRSGMPAGHVEQQTLHLSDQADQGCDSEPGVLRSLERMGCLCIALICHLSWYFHIVKVLVLLIQFMQFLGDHSSHCYVKEDS